MEISVGAILEGNIKSITKFGAFVSLPGGRSGLVHISEVCKKRIRHPSEMVKVGDVVKVVVLEVDEKRKRISLSMRDVVEK